MPNYSNSKIYRVISEIGKVIYIGGTTQTLANRMCDYRKGYKQWVEKRQNYIRVFEVLNYDDYKIELIQNFPCINKSQLAVKINQIITECGAEEYQIANELQTNFIEYDSQKEYMKQNYANNKKYHSKQRKEYYIENKTKLLAQMEKYYNANKETIREKQKKKYTCEVCNIELVKRQKRRHEKTKRHQDNLAE
jgi:hypothetical protein